MVFSLSLSSIREHSDVLPLFHSSALHFASQTLFESHLIEAHIPPFSSSHFSFHALFEILLLNILLNRGVLLRYLSLHLSLSTVSLSLVHLLLFVLSVKQSPLLCLCVYHHPINFSSFSQVYRSPSFVFLWPPTSLPITSEMLLHLFLLSSIFSFVMGTQCSGEGCETKYQCNQGESISIIHSPHLSLWIAQKTRDWEVSLPCDTRTHGIIRMYDSTVFSDWDRMGCTSYVIIPLTTLFASGVGSVSAHEFSSPVPRPVFETPCECNEGWNDLFCTYPHIYSKSAVITVHTPTVCVCRYRLPFSSLLSFNGLSLVLSLLSRTQR